MLPDLGQTPSSTSYTLIELVGRQDEQAWHTFASLYSGYIQARLRICGVRESDLEDLGQDVLAAVAAHIGEFQPRHAKGSFRGWVKQVVRNKAIDHFRQGKMNPQAQGGAEADEQLAQIPFPESEEEAAEETAVAELYQRALDIIQTHFEQNTWRMFLRVVMEERSPAEVAAEFQVSPAAVRMAKVRVLRKLRETLGEPLE